MAARTSGCSGWYLGFRIDPRQRRAAAAGEAPLACGRVRFVELDGVVIRQLLAGADVTDGHDPHMVAIRNRLAVGFTGMVDEPRGVAAHVGVDHPLLVEGEQVGVLRLLLATRQGGVPALALGLGDRLPVYSMMRVPAGMRAVA